MVRIVISLSSECLNDFKDETYNCRYATRKYTHDQRTQTENAQGKHIIDKPSLVLHRVPEQ